jgi:hypothetical protein
MSDDQSKSKFTDRTWLYGMSGVIGVSSLFFTAGAIFDSSVDGASTIGRLKATAYALWFGLLSLGVFGAARDRTWGGKLTNATFIVALMFFQVAAIVFLLRPLLIDREPNIAGMTAAATWLLIGWAVYVEGKWRDGNTLSYLECGLWPLTAMLKNPFGFFVLFYVPLGLIAVAQAVGRIYGHPVIGGVAGLAVCAALLFASWKLLRV